MDDYGYVLERTSEMLESVRGAYSDLRFTDAMEVYGEIAKIYARHLGLDIRDAYKIKFLLESVATTR